jgi:hypothetical protein
MTKIKVLLEGRENIFIPDKQSLIDFIKAKKLKYVHKMEEACFAFLGCDYSKEEVIQAIFECDRVALLFIDDPIVNHSLRIIKNNEMKAFDVPINIKDLEIHQVL